MCTMTGCTNKPHRKGWCAKHYRRWRLYGDPTMRRQPGRFRRGIPGWEVHCGDCHARVAVVDTDPAIWQALAAHRCP